MNALRDKYGNTIGYIKEDATKREIFNKYGNKLGYMNKSDKITRNTAGNLVAYGDMLTTLL